MLKEKIRILDKYGKPQVVGYIVADTLPNDPDYVSIGISKCHKSDIFDREIGEATAYFRISEFDKEITFNNLDYVDKHGNVQSLKYQFFNFIERCIKYYKDKNVIIPKIKFKNQYMLNTKNHYYGNYKM